MSKKNISGYEKLIISLVMLLPGILFAVQVRTVLTAKQESEDEEEIKIYETMRQAEKLEREWEQKRETVDELKNKYSAMLLQLAEQDETFYRFLQQYHKNLDQNKAAAGLSAAAGNGIEIRLDDGNPVGSISGGMFMVHDATLAELINELRAAGAEAISINGQRIVAMTEFYCMGTSIRINGKKYFPPYTIKAIGNPQQLESKVRDSVVFAAIEARNLIIDIIPRTNFTISPYNGNIEDSLQGMNLNPN